MQGTGASQSEIALFRRHPGLADRLPRHAFLSGVTPVTPLPLEGLGEGRLLVKRDDQSCSLYGGNKPRKLEFIIGAALSHGSRRLVTTGGLGTHHGLATTILGAEAGLATTLVLVDQPVTDEVRQSLLLFCAYGAEVIHGRNVPGTAARVLGVLAGAAVRGERPRLVPSGGSSAIANLGFVSAGLELAEQGEGGELPEPSELFVAVGTGGTLSGLLLGLRLAGLTTRVVGVLVTDILPPSPRRLVRQAHRSLRLLRRADPRIPACEITTRDFDLVAGQLGAGYGAPTQEAQVAVDTAAKAQLQLETTYTGKCLAEVLARAQRGALPNGPVLLWNTFNAVDVVARAPRRADPQELPASLQRLYREVPR
jgi:D-cysteine desulfhydrase